MKQCLHTVSHYLCESFWLWVHIYAWMPLILIEKQRWGWKALKFAKHSPEISAKIQCHTGVELCLQICLHRVVYRVEGNTAGDLVDWTLCKMHTALGIVHITLHYIVQDASNNHDTAGELNLWSILVPHHLTSERRTSQTDHLQRNSYSARCMLLNLPQHLAQVEMITFYSLPSF